MEKRPARLIHRAAEIMTEFEQEQTEPLTIEKQINGKRILLNGKMVAWTLSGNISFSRFLRDRYSEEAIQQIQAFAES